MFNRSGSLHLIKNIIMKKLALLSLVMVVVSLYSAYVHKSGLSRWKDAYWEVKELYDETLLQNVNLYKAIHKHKETLPTEFLLDVFPRDSAEILKNAQEKVHED